MSETDLSQDTLTGDVRDVLLTHIRAMETPWSKLSERQQREKIDAAAKAAETLVRGAVRIVSTAGFPHVVVSTGKFTVKDGVKLEVIASSSVDNITKLAEHGTGGAVLVLAEVSAFFGERKAAKPDPDQPDLPIDGEGDAASQAASIDHDPETGEVIEAAPIEELPDAEAVAATPPTAEAAKGGRRQRAPAEAA